MLSNPVCVDSVSIIEHVVSVLAQVLMLLLTVSSPCHCLPAATHCHAVEKPGTSLQFAAPISVQRMLLDGVEDPVHLCCPAAMMCIIHLFCEILQSLLLSFVQG